MRLLHSGILICDVLFHSHLIFADWFIDVGIWYLKFSSCLRLNLSWMLWIGLKATKNGVHLFFFEIPLQYRVTGLEVTGLAI